MTYEELCSFEVLYKAYLEARKGKRSKSKTIEYEAQALACTEKLSRKLAVCNVRQPDGSIRQQIDDVRNPLKLRQERGLVLRAFVCDIDFHVNLLTYRPKQNDRRTSGHDGGRA